MPGWAGDAPCLAFIRLMRSGRAGVGNRGPCGASVPRRARATAYNHGAWLQGGYGKNHRRHPVFGPSSLISTVAEVPCQTRPTRSCEADTSAVLSSRARAALVHTDEASPAAKRTLWAGCALSRSSWAVEALRARYVTRNCSAILASRSCAAWLTDKPSVTRIGHGNAQAWSCTVGSRGTQDALLYRSSPCYCREGSSWAHRLRGSRASWAVPCCWACLGSCQHDSVTEETSRTLLTRSKATNTCVRPSRTIRT